jgi:hypothetical protein
VNGGIELVSKRAAGPALLAAGALIATSMAACGVFRSPSSPSLSGMEKQISRGERVSAATRAHAAQRAPRVVATPSPARPATARRIPGSQVTAVGDSVMAASAMTLAGVLPGIYIDARPDREMPAGLAILRRLAATGRLRPVVVIGLGTNYLVTTSQLDQVLRVLGPYRKLVLINTYVPDSWSKQVNATDAAFARAHPDVVLADWFDTIKNRLYLLWPDQIHPEMPGTRVYARLVDRAIQATRAVPAAPTWPAARAGLSPGMRG